MRRVSWRAAFAAGFVAEQIGGGVIGIEAGGCSFQLFALQGPEGVDELL